LHCKEQEHLPRNSPELSLVLLGFRDFYLVSFYDYTLFTATVAASLKKSQHLTYPAPEKLNKSSSSFPFVACGVVHKSQGSLFPGLIAGIHSG